MQHPRKSSKSLAPTPAPGTTSGGIARMLAIGFLVVGLGLLAKGCAETQVPRREYIEVVWVSEDEATIDGKTFDLSQYGGRDKVRAHLGGRSEKPARVVVPSAALEFGQIVELLQLVMYVVSNDTWLGVAWRSDLAVPFPYGQVCPHGEWFEFDGRQWSFDPNEYLQVELTDQPLDLSPDRPVRLILRLDDQVGEYLAAARRFEAHGIKWYNRWIRAEPGPPLRLKEELRPWAKRQRYTPSSVPGIEDQLPPGPRPRK